MKSTSRRPLRRRPRHTPRRPPPQRRPRPRKQPPIIPETSTRGSPPTSFELLQEAALTLKKEERRGVTLTEIRRQVLKKYKGRFDKASNDLLTTTLRRLAKRGKVICRQGYKYMFNDPHVAKHKQNRDDTDAEKIANSGGNTNSFVSATTATSGGSATPTEPTEGTNGRSLNDSRTSASSQSDTGSRSTRSRSSKSSKGCTKTTRDTKSTKNTKSSTKSTKSARSVKRKEAQDEPQDKEKAPQDGAQSPEKVEEEEEEEKSSATGDLSSSVAVTGYTTSMGSRDSSKRRR